MRDKPGGALLRLAAGRLASAKYEQRRRNKCRHPKRRNLAQSQRQRGVINMSSMKISKSKRENARVYHRRAVIKYIMAKSSVSAPWQLGDKLPSIAKGRLAHVESKYRGRCRRSRNRVSAREPARQNRRVAERSENQAIVKAIAPAHHRVARKKNNRSRKESAAHGSSTVFSANRPLTAISPLSCQPDREGLSKPCLVAKLAVSTS